MHPKLFFTSIDIGLSPRSEYAQLTNHPATSYTAFTVLYESAIRRTRTLAEPKHSDSFISPLTCAFDNICPIFPPLIIHHEDTFLAFLLLCLSVKFIVNRLRCHIHQRQSIPHHSSSSTAKHASSNLNLRRVVHTISHHSLVHAKHLDSDW